MPETNARKSTTVELVEPTFWKSTTAPSLSERRGKEGEAKELEASTLLDNADE